VIIFFQWIQLIRLFTWWQKQRQLPKCCVVFKQRSSATTCITFNITNKINTSYILYIKLKLWVLVCVCVCVYVCLWLKNKYTNFKLGMLIPWNQEEILKRSKFQKSVLGLKPSDSGFCILETKHDRRTLPRSKLFAWTRRLQEQWPQHWKTILGSSPGEDSFCNLETKHDRTVKRTKLFATTRRLQKLRSQTRKLSWVHVSMKMLG
jgi:hypothetical protein